MTIRGDQDHVPTEESRANVIKFSGAGLIQDQIAVLIGINDKTLRKYYRREIDLGKAKANYKIGGTLFNKAVDGDTTAMIFYLKTQAGWKEKTEIDHSISGGTSKHELIINVNGT